MTTEERLERLEKELARHRLANRWLLTVVCLCIGAWVLAAIFSSRTANAQAAGAPPKELHANRLFLEDGNGKTRAVLDMTTVWSALLLLDEKGQGRAVLFVDKNGPGLNLADSNGKIRVDLLATTDGPRLRLFDEKGEPRATLGVTKDGPELNLYDGSAR